MLWILGFAARKPTGFVGAGCTRPALAAAYLKDITRRQ